MYDLVIRGRIVTPDGILDHGWLACAGDTIMALGTGAAPASGNVEDFGDAFIMPGGIDGQTHAGSQIGISGLGMTTHAAVMGGITTIVDMPYDHPAPLTTGALLREKVAAIDAHALCDVALYGTVPTSPDAEDVRGLIAGGVCAFKISSFEAHPDRFPRIDNPTTLSVLKMIEGTGLPLGLHNEDQEIVRQVAAQFKAQGRTSPADHDPSRPPVAELVATANFLELAAATSAHAHIVHISLADGFRLVDAYRARGVAATAEMCAHYLIFDANTDMPHLGGLLKVNPPIRSGQIDALWRVLDDGLVSFVSSDHSAWGLESKVKQSIFEVAAGMPGLEVLYPGFFTAAAARKGVDAAALLSASYLAEKPAEFFGLSKKGRLTPGYDADIAVLTPGAVTYDSKRNTRGPGWSAYDGMTFEVTPTATFVRGRKVWDGEAVVAAAGSGRYVARG